MKIRRHICVIALYMVAMFIITILGGIFTEFALIPFLDWAKGFPGYTVPEWGRLLAWLKMSIFAGIVGGIACWFAVKDRF